MKAFADAGFLLTLLLATDGSPVAWEIARKIKGPLPVSWLLLLLTENRLNRRMEDENCTASATHFLSFDPRTRDLARRAGLKLLPTSL